MARDTVRLGIAVRGTLLDWLVAWGGIGVFFAIVVPGLVITGGLAYGARRAAPAVARSWPVVPVLAFAGSVFCFWVDFVESRSLQAAPPDTCFIHGVAHALHDGVTGKGWVRHGLSLRTPAPVPPLPVPQHRPNVIVVISESMRADATCSAPPPFCISQFLDPVLPERMPLGKPHDAVPGHVQLVHAALDGARAERRFPHGPLGAGALGDRPRRRLPHGVCNVAEPPLRRDFGTFVCSEPAIDVEVTAMELGATIDAQVGAPDERATERMLAFAREQPPGSPYFAVLHFSNTHAPYRVDPAFLPYKPSRPIRPAISRPSTTTTRTASGSRSGRSPRSCTSSARRPPGTRPSSSSYRITASSFASTAGSTTSTRSSRKRSASRGGSPQGPTRSIRRRVSRSRGTRRGGPSRRT